MSFPNETRPEDINPSHPERWPLLSLLGSRAVLYPPRGAPLQYEAAPAGQENRGRILEEIELDLARGKNPDPTRVYWSVPEKNLRRFLETCRRLGWEAGGLRQHALFGADLPLEALARSSEEKKELMVLRLREQSFGDQGAGEPEEESSSVGRPPRVFIYFNPLGDPPLPHAREESSLAYDLFQERAETRYLGRPLSGEELNEHYSWADIILYFGHGKQVGGLPAIPGAQGFFPFPDLGGGPADYPGKIAIFAACLEKEAPPPAFAAGAALYPACRIADRASPFLGDLFRSWAGGRDLMGAFRVASESDAARGDIRRFIFRLQGMNALSSRPALFE